MRGEITDLNTQIINNGRECTNEIIRREKEILVMIGELENKMRRTESTYHIQQLDTIMTTSPVMTNSSMMRELGLIKKDIKNHIEQVKK
jgi:hypothetical protein